MRGCICLNNLSTCSQIIDAILVQFGNEIYIDIDRTNLILIRIDRVQTHTLHEVEIEIYPFHENCYWYRNIERSTKFAHTSQYSSQTFHNGVNSS